MNAAVMNLILPGSVPMILQPCLQEHLTLGFLGFWDYNSSIVYVQTARKAHFPTALVGEVPILFRRPLCPALQVALSWGPQSSCLPALFSLSGQLASLSA